MNTKFLISNLTLMLMLISTGVNAKSSIILKNDNNGEQSALLVEAVKVDAVKVVSEESTTSRGCSLTVQYFSEGQPVGSPITYTGTPCPWNGSGPRACREYKALMLSVIQEHVAENGTIMPQNWNPSC